MSGDGGSLVLHELFTVTFRTIVARCNFSWAIQYPGHDHAAFWIYHISAGFLLPDHGRYLPLFLELRTMVLVQRLVTN